MSKPKRKLSKCREWERERRDRLNVSFQALYRVLPSYDPAVEISKIEIIKRSTEYIEDLQKQNRTLLTEGPEKENLKKQEFEELQTRLDNFSKRIEQLTGLLKDARIKIPSECGTIKHFNRWYLLSNKVTAEQAEVLAEKANKKQNEEKKSKMKLKKRASMKALSVLKSNSSQTVLAKRNTSKQLRKVVSENKCKKLVNRKNLLQSHLVDNKRTPVVHFLNSSNGSGTSSVIIPQINNTYTLLPSNGVIKIPATQSSNVIANLCSSASTVMQAQQSFVIQGAPVKRTNDIITNSCLLSSPVMTTSIRPTEQTASSLGPGMLILANGTIVPLLQTASNVIQPQPTVFTAVINTSQPAQQTVALLPNSASNVIKTGTVLSDAIKLVTPNNPDKVQTLSFVSNSTSSIVKTCPNKSLTTNALLKTSTASSVMTKSSNSEPVICSSADKISNKQFHKIAPKLGITKTITINKLPIPALPSRFKNKPNNTSDNKPVTKKNSTVKSINQEKDDKSKSIKTDNQSDNLFKENKTDLGEDKKNDTNNKEERDLNVSVTTNVTDNKTNSEQVVVNKQTECEDGSNTDVATKSDNSLKRKINELSSESQSKRTKLDITSDSQVNSINTTENNLDNYNVVSKPSAVNNYSIDSLCKNATRNKCPVSAAPDLSVDLDAMKKPKENEPVMDCKDVKNESKKFSSPIKINNLFPKKHIENKNKTVTDAAKIAEISADLSKENNMTTTGEACDSLNISVPHSELSNDIFASLQVPVGGQHPESMSPTAAFLLAFPLVSTLTGGKVTEIAEDENSDSQRDGTPTLLQIGTFDITKTSQVDNLNSNILSLDNFFSNKDLSSNFYSCYENTAAPHKQVTTNKKHTEFNLSDNKFLDVNNSNITYITPAKDKSSKLPICDTVQKSDDPLYHFNSLQTSSTLASCIFSDMSLFRNSKISDNVFNYEHSSVLKDVSKNMTELNLPVPPVMPSSSTNVCQSGTDLQMQGTTIKSLNCAEKTASSNCSNLENIPKNSTGKQSFSDNVTMSPCQINAQVDNSNVPLKSFTATNIQTNNTQYNTYNQFSTNSDINQLPSTLSCNYGTQQFPKYADHFLNYGNDNQIFSLPTKTDNNKCKTSKMNCQQTTFGKPIYTTSQDQKYEETKCKNNKQSTVGYKGTKSMPVVDNKKVTNTSYSQRLPVNWMTAPDIKSTQQHTNDFYIPPLGKEFDYGQNSIFPTNTFQTPSHIPPTTSYYNNGNSLYSVVDSQNNSVLTDSSRKTSMLDQHFNIVPPSAYSRNSTLLQNDENQFSWSPTKMPPFIDNHNLVIPSTLPTLLGDLALNPTTATDRTMTSDLNKYCNVDHSLKKVNELHKETAYASKDIRNKYNSKDSQVYSQQSSFNNILSVSQLVDHSKSELNTDTSSSVRRSNMTNVNLKSSVSNKHMKRFQKGTERQSGQNSQPKDVKESKNIPNMSSFNYSSFARNNTENIQEYRPQMDKLQNRTFKNLSKNYSAEALIGHNASSDADQNNSLKTVNHCHDLQHNQNVPVFTKKNQTVPSFGSDSYFPSVDIAATQDSRYFSNQSQTQLHQNLMTYSLANSTYQGNSVTNTSTASSNFMLPETDTLDYNQFIGGISDNKQTVGNKTEYIKMSHKTDHNKQINSKRKQYLNESSSCVDIGFLPIPAGIASPLLTEDVFHAGLLPTNSSQLYSNNSLYPKTYNQTHSSSFHHTSLLPEPVNRSVAPLKESHVTLSTVIGNTGSGGTSVTNFNLSTIFPEINKAYKHKVNSSSNETCGHKTK